MLLVVNIIATLNQMYVHCRLNPDTRMVVYIDWWHSADTVCSEELSHSARSGHSFYSS